MPSGALGQGRRGGTLADVLPFRLRAASRGWPGLSLALRDGGGRLRQALETEAERRRLFLWLPVMMGIGILLYFAADTEPAFWAPAAGFSLATGLAAVLRRHRLALHLCLALAAVFAGFAAASWRTAAIATPILDRSRIGQLSGYVESVEARDAGARLVVFVTAIAGVAPERQPRRVRVNIKTGSVAPGDHITANARLLPPPGPARPGGYDFGRDAYSAASAPSAAFPARSRSRPRPGRRRPDWR